MKLTEKETIQLILSIHSDVSQAVDNCYKRYNANEMIGLLSKIKKQVDQLTTSEVFNRKVKDNA
jgi:hypothetical protein